jgi:hypothetical protein
MNDPRKQSHPSVRLGIFIVVVVLIVIGILLYNAISGKREYDRENAVSSDTSSAPAASTGAGASSSGAAQ